MSDAASIVRRHAGAALAELHDLSPTDPHVSKRLAEVLGRLIAMRDEFIRAQREEQTGHSELRRVNAILSSIFGVEFPSEGLQWQRVCATRDSLQALLDDVSGAERPGPRLH